MAGRRLRNITAITSVLTASTFSLLSRSVRGRHYNMDRQKGRIEDENILMTEEGPGTEKAGEVRRKRHSLRDALFDPSAPKATAIAAEMETGRTVRRSGVTRIALGPARGVTALPGSGAVCCDNAVAFPDGENPISLDLRESFDLLRGRPLDFNQVDGLDLAQAEVKPQVAL